MRHGEHIYLQMEVDDKRQLGDSRQDTGVYGAWDQERYTPTTHIQRMTRKHLEGREHTRKTKGKTLKTLGYGKPPSPTHTHHPGTCQDHPSTTLVPGQFVLPPPFLICNSPLSPQFPPPPPSHALWTLPVLGFLSLHASVVSSLLYPIPKGLPL